MKYYGAFFSTDGLSLVAETGHFNLHSTHPNFNRIREILMDTDPSPDGTYEAPIDDLIDIATSITKQTKGLVTISNNTVYYNGQPLNNAVVSFLLTLLSEGHDVSPWINFTNSLMANPSFRSREQLFRFVEANKISVNAQGELLLYKRVRYDFFDVHTARTHKYAPGSTISMPRDQVDDDPNRTCSAGLHVAAHSYIASFSGERVVICAVAPEDVVSIPTDYNNAKMRVCKLRVVAEQPQVLSGPTLTSSYIDEDTFEDQPEEEWNV